MSVAIGALALLAAWGEIPRESIVKYFVWLAREGLERQPKCRVGRSGQRLCGYRSLGGIHVASPMQKTDAMFAFYRALGLQVTENSNRFSVHIGQVRPA